MSHEPFDRAFEGELRDLWQSGAMPEPGFDGTTSLVLGTAAAGAAANKYGQFLVGAQSANTYVVKAAGGSLVAAVCEGNYKDPLTVIAGCIVGSELVKAMASVEGDCATAMRTALSTAHERIFSIGQARTPISSSRFGWFSSQRRNLHGIGTSIAAIAASESLVALCAIGECCVYRAHDEHCSRVTVPDIMENSSQFGELDDEQREFFRDIPTKLLGMSETLDFRVDIVEASAGDTFVLATGAHELMGLTTAEPSELWRDPVRACKRLTATPLLAERSDLSATSAVVALGARPR